MEEGSETMAMRSEDVRKVPQSVHGTKTVKQNEVFQLVQLEIMMLIFVTTKLFLYS